MAYFFLDLAIVKIPFKFLSPDLDPDPHPDNHRGAPSNGHHSCVKLKQSSQSEQ